MSRNKTNIKMQLNKMLDKKLCIGEKKTEDIRDTRNGYNSARYEGIHSVKTADTYDTRICAQLSQQLGHNRISVVINSYLRK